MRFPTRSLATLSMLVGVATCSDTPIATVKAGSVPAGRSIGRLAIAPVFSKSAAYAVTHLADFPTLRYDSARVVLRRKPGNDVFLDTTVAFTPDSPDLPVSRDLDLARDGRQFDVTIDYRTLDGAVMFSGSGTVDAYPANEPPPPAKPVTIAFVGPGARAKSISISPKTLGIVGNQSAALTITGVDSSNNPISVPIVSWTSSAANVATVSATGVVQGQNRRGTATITVVTPGGLSDNASVSVSLPPSAIAVVSGNGQTGRVGSTLANPAVVQVSASDGIGVAGVSVIFAGPSGGSVTPATATTDANGRASMTMKLGTVAGPQGFTATAAGVSTAFTATATPGDPSVVTIVSGNNQSDSVHAVLAPLSVRVSDSFGNVVPNAPVSWTKSGGGSLAAATTTSNAEGIATNSYTLGGAIGTETATASAGTSAVTFTFTAGGGRPTAIAAVSGNGQSGRVSQPLANPMVVKVADASGNPVRNAPIIWTAQNATIASTTPSDANGQASANVTLGTAAGPAMVTAAIAGAQSVSFAATALAGPPANAFFSTQPANGVATQSLAPVRVAVRDAANNVAEGSVTIALGNNPSGAVLGGTLTQPAVDGVATFGNLTVDRMGTGYTLRASVGAGIAATSAAFNIAANGAGVPTQLMFVPSSPTSFTLTAGQPLTLPQVKVVDALGSGVPNITVHAAVDSGVAPNIAELASGDFTTDAAGLATLVAPTTTDAGVYRLTVTSTAVPGASLVISGTINPGAPAAIKFRQPPIGGPRVPVPAGTVLPIVVAIVDAYGNVVTSDSSSVSIKLNVPADVTGAGLNDSSAVSAVRGVATFTNRFITKAATGYSLNVTAGALTATSGPIDINPAAAAKLVFSPVPTGAIVGESLFVHVRIQDAYGNIVRDAGTDVTLASSPSATGTGPKSPFFGNASFTVSFPAAGNYALTATAGALTPATASVAVTSLASALRATTTEFVNRVGDVSTITTTVTAVDASANSVAGLPITFAVVNGPCTIASAPGGNTDGSGSFSATINLPGSAGSCAIRATGTGITGPITFTAVNAPAIATHVWMGSIDDDWAVPSNWRVLPSHTAGVPTTASVVYVPRNAYTTAKLRANASTGTFITETGSSFDMGGTPGYTLTVAGSVDAAGTFLNAGTMVLDASSLATIRLATAPGIVSVGDATNNCRGGAATYSLSGDISMSGQLWLRCPLTVAGKTIRTGNLYTSTANGVLVMTDARDNVVVSDSLRFGGGDETGKLTAGVLEAYTHFTVAGSKSFVATGTHRTKFLANTSQGKLKQLITFQDTTSYFNDVEIRSAVDSGFTLTTPVKVAGNLTVNGGIVSGASPLYVSGSVAANTSADLGRLKILVSRGSTFPSYENTVAGKAPALTVITGTTTSLSGTRTVAGGLMVDTGGSLNLNGNTLTILDSMRVSGRLDMLTSGGPNNVLKVGGNVFFDRSSSTSHVQAGRLEVGGDFTESGTSPTSFDPSSGFTVVLNGRNLQKVTFSHPVASFFDRLEIANTSVDSVSFESNIQVNGSLRLRSGAVASIASNQRLSFGNGATLFLHDGSKFYTNGAISGTFACQRGANVQVSGSSSTSIDLLRLAIDSPAGICAQASLP